MAANHSKDMSWQAQKSEKTRSTIMDAVIRCYIKYGYTNTIVTNIAQEAGVSRGAMMHHFDDRLDIIRSSVKYLEEQRLHEFKTLISKASVDDGYTVNEDNLRITINALWKFFHIPSYIAYQELLVAARTDKELAKVMDPTQKDFDHRISELIRSMFPAWNDMESTRAILTDLVFYTLQGMAISKINNRKQARIQNLLDFLVKESHAMYLRANKE